MSQTGISETSDDVGDQLNICAETRRFFTSVEFGNQTDEMSTGTFFCTPSLWAVVRNGCDWSIFKAVEWTTAFYK